MKKLRTIMTAIALLWATAASAVGPFTAQCPPVVPNSGVTASVRPPLQASNPAGCDFGFTVGTSMIVLQAPVNRHFFKLQNTSTGGQSIGICFANLELGVSCTMATAGTILTPGQPFYQSVAMYNGLAPPFNSIFFSASIEVIASGPGATMTVTVD